MPGRSGHSERTDVTDDILEFIRDRFRAAIGARPVTVQTALFSSGIVDSFGVLELIAFLEDRFRVNIDPARHDLTEFDTVEKIVSLVERLKT
jgi:acyl carrier protein